MTVKEAIEVLADFEGYPWGEQTTTDLSEEECRALVVLLNFAKEQEKDNGD